jgi:hypothetical protein
MKKHSPANTDKSSYKPVLVNGHEYPFDPASEEFTDMLMDCFQRGRNAAAGKQRLKSLAAIVPISSEKLTPSQQKVAPGSRPKVPTRTKTGQLTRHPKAQPKLKHA